MTPKLVAVIACRLKGTRLYGKPLQLIDIERDKTILESCVEYIETVKSLDEVCLAISEEPENQAFVPIAEKHDWPMGFGDPTDVLGRIVKVAEKLQATHILRVTSECPFVHAEPIDELFQSVLNENADYASLEGLPEGTGFEIIKMDALKISHDRGTPRNRSELVTSYIFENQEDFRILRPQSPALLRRPEVRVTVDYPEDLIFCRKIYRDLGGHEKLISIERVIEYWDKNAAIRAQVQGIGVDWGTGRIWT